MMNIMKGLFLTGLILFFALNLSAILQDYLFLQTTTEYSEITGGILLGNETTDEQRFVNPDIPLGGTVNTGPGFPIGFEFMLNNYIYDRLAICANGWISFGQSTLTPSVNIGVSSIISPISSTLAITPAQLAMKVALFARDLKAQPGATLRMEVLGSAPERICVIQWHNYRRYSMIGDGDAFNFQLLLYETLNKIEFRYGPFTIGNTGVTSIVQVGMRALAPTDYNNRQTTTDWSSTLGGGDNQATCSLNNTVYPVNGLTFAYFLGFTIINNLMALDVTGSTTPTVGQASVYTVHIRNSGSAPQSDYTVKLMNGETELTSVAGPPIDGQTSMAVPISWTPATPGQIQLTGKVVLQNDEIPWDNISSPLNILIMPQGSTAVLVGDGSQTSFMSPISFSYHTSLVETIFYPTEINHWGTITSVSFFSNLVSGIGDKLTRIWIGTTNLDDLSNGWIPSTQLTQVVEDMVNYPNGETMITIPFSVPFEYAGGNLVLMIQRPMDTTGYSTSDVFKNQTIGNNRSRRTYSDVVTINPASPPTGTLTGQFPQTLFQIVEGITPSFAMSPSSYDFGPVNIDTTNDRQFYIYNMSGTPFTVNSISISGSPMYSLQDLPALPVTITAGNMTSFIARFHPTATGIHTATITVTDNLNRSFNIGLNPDAVGDRDRIEHNAPLTGTCIDPILYTLPYVQAFDGVTQPALPADWSRLVEALFTTAYVKTVTNTYHSAPNCVAMDNSSDLNAQLILIAPPLANTIPITTVRVKFWYKGSSIGLPLEVGVLPDAGNPLSFQNVELITGTTTWTEYTVSYQTYAGQGGNIAFKHGGGDFARTLYIDDVMIEVIPQNDLEASTITGSTCPVAGLISIYTIQVFNWSVQTQSNYQVMLCGPGEEELSVVTGTPVAPDASVSVSVPWTPVIPGQIPIYGKVVMATDQNNLNNQTPILNVYVQSEGTTIYTIGEGNQQALIPVNMDFRNSLFETIYQSGELNFTGVITGLCLYNNFYTDLPGKPTKIWLGTTTQTDLNDGWIASTDLTQVFDGLVYYPVGANQININFPTPFQYLQGNLVMMVNRPMDTGFYSSMDKFYTQTWGSNRSRYFQSDTMILDPASPPEVTILNGQFPKTGFLVIPGGVGHLTGTVFGSGNQPLPNATVQIQNGNQTITDTEGHYIIYNILPGDYSVTSSHYGYENSTQIVSIIEGETATLNFTLIQMPMVTISGTIVGSDTNTVGLPGATISLTGYAEYQATANAAGVFTIPGVYANRSYDYVASAEGYQDLNGEVAVGFINLDMGNIVLNEVTNSPRNVNASVAPDEISVTINWLAPDP